MSYIQSHSPDLEPFKEVPGYQTILKAVLKSQIQFLVEQLSEQTGEESVLLTASVADGTLSHLGSSCGKFFLRDHEEFKSQFLGFCLKRQLKRKSEEVTDPVDVTTISAKSPRLIDEESRPSSLPQTYSHKDVPLQSSSQPKPHVKIHGAPHILGVVDIPSSFSQLQSKSHCPSKSSGCLKSVSSESYSDEYLGSSSTVIPKDRSVSSPDKVKTDLEGNIGLEGGIVSTDFVSDRCEIGVTHSEESVDDHGLAIKQEPVDTDKYGTGLETLSGADRTSTTSCSSQESWNKHASRLQTHVKFSKGGVPSSASSEQFSEAGPSTWNPMLSDYYLREVLSQIATKAAQLTEVNVDTSSSVTVPPGEKPFRCHLCGRGFTQRGNLEVHMWTQHGNQ